MMNTEKSRLKKTVLVVDDEESIRFTFAHFLQNEGYEVLTAPDLRSAKKILASTRTDLIFLDIILGGDSGLELLKEIKRLGLNCPVVMITGKPTLTNATEALRYGAFDFLIKPVRKDNLLHATNLAINHKVLLDEKELVTREKETYRTNLEAIFQSVNDAIMTVDENMRVIDANKHIQAISGIPTKKVTCRSE